MVDAPVLLHLSYSPFSERARSALDHHGIAYERLAHEPFVGERRLRRRLGTPRGQRATVPALFVDGQVLGDSWDIAEYADRVGPRAPLIPSDRRNEIRRLVELADRGSAHGRALVTFGLLAHPKALDETLPPRVPGFVRPLLRPVTRYGSRWFARKYGIEATTPHEAREALASVLDGVRAELAGARHVLGELSYADVALATLLQCVSPVGDRYVPLGAGSRRAWTDADLAARFADLVAWRDRLYRDHRESP